MMELRAYPWYFAPIVVVEHYTRLTVLTSFLARHRDKTASQLRRPRSVGEVIDLDYLEPRGMEDWELANILDIEENDLLDVCLGVSDLTPEIADKLDHALGTKAGYWLRIEHEYREFIKKETSNVAVSV
jgi:addiction module HigA family antidote